MAPTPRYAQHRRRLELRVGHDDRRLAKAYPGDNETAVESSCTHGHVDEWARMGNPQRVWQAIEPTMAGSCHIVTTGLGPMNYSSTYWQRCLAGDARHHPCFIGALARPDRTKAWLKAQRGGMDEQQFRQEYPVTWQDALSGGGEFIFTQTELEQAATDFRGLGPAQPGHTYVTAWDIGRYQDAAVGIVLDITEDVHDVVAYRRLRGASYPQIQREIEALHKAYPGITAVEKNAAGAAVLENLNLPEHELEGFTTTRDSKARIIQQLKLKMQQWCIKWDAEACPQLDAEMRGYQIPTTMSSKTRSWRSRSPKNSRRKRICAKDASSASGTPKAEHPRHGPGCLHHSTLRGHRRGGTPISYSGRTDRCAPTAPPPR
jgi:hypothetical protein